jgi:mercuric ion transport protein
MNEERSSRADQCLKTGVCGSIAAICCAAPLLAIALASVGLAAMVPYLDYILVPLLVGFLLLALYGWLKSRGEGTVQR